MNQSTNPSRGRKIRAAFLATATLAAGIGIGLMARAEGPMVGYTDTPFIFPGSKWRVHDAARPQPRVIDPGTASTQDQPGRPPSDAIVLFDGKDLSKWRDANGKPSGWKIEDGAMVVPPKGTPGGGTIYTKDEFGDCQLHVEWTAPTPPMGESQGRGNSGILFFGRYEVQVLDSYKNPTYADGGAAALYGQYPPLVNATRKPGDWQVYDILFTAPKFEGDKLVKPAYATVMHNGVYVHNHAEILGPMLHRVATHYTPHGPRGSLALQDHNNPVRFRNIWIRELKDYDQP